MGPEDDFDAWWAGQDPYTGVGFIVDVGDKRVGVSAKYMGELIAEKFRDRDVNLDKVMDAVMGLDYDSMKLRAKVSALRAYLED